MTVGHRPPFAPAPARTDVLIDDPLLSFDAEPAPGPAIDPPPPVAPVRRRRGRVAGLVVVGAVLIGAAFAAVHAGSARDAGSSAVTPTTGIVEITSQPAGATVAIDGEPRGVTPLRLPVIAGAHVIEVSSGGMKSSLPLGVDAGTTLRQHIEFTSGPAAPDTASPAIPPVHESESRDLPASAMAPIAAATGAPAAALDVPAAAATDPSLAIGWVRLRAPIALDASEQGRPMAPTASGRLRLSPGSHELEISNDPFGYRATLRVEVVAGKTMTATVALPNGTVSIAAVPWATVSVDGTPVGTTPIGRLSLPIGLHDVIWRHPQFGERRQTITVTERSPVDIEMDLSK